MKVVYPVIAVFILLLICIPTGNSARAEQVATPTDLSKLLPEGGLGEGLDYWVYRRNKDTDIDVYTRYSFVPEGESFTAKFTEIVAHKDGFIAEKTSRKTNLSEAGHLVSRDELTQISLKGVWITRTLQTSRVAKGAYVSEAFGETDEPGVSFDVGEPATPRVDIKDFADALPRCLLPLVYAYHIRKGNLDYAVKVYWDPHYLIGLRVSRMTVEDIGTEWVDFEGGKREAHVLKITEKVGSAVHVPGADQEDSYRVSRLLTVFKDGTIFREAAKHSFREEPEPVSKRVRFEEIAKKIKKHNDSGNIKHELPDDRPVD